MNATDTDQVKIKFKCLKCGGTIVELPDDYTDDSIAKCKACGQEFGRWADVKSKAVDVLRQDVGEKLRGVFKGLKGWKVK